MDFTTVLLMLFAGLLHAGWHAIAKMRDGLPLLAGMGIVSAAITLPFLFVVKAPAPSVWPVIVLSLALHAGYKASLAYAYDHGDLTKAYPLARGMVPLFAALLSWLALDQLPTAWQLAGIALISASVIALALERTATALNGRLMLSAMGAGAMVAGYSVVDAYGTRVADWASFTAWLIVLDSMCFLGIARLLRGRKLWRQLNDEKAASAIAGALGLFSFAVFLWALSRNPVAPVAAFRECSIVFATVFGLAFLHEQISRLRMVAVACILVGLMTVAIMRQ